MANKANGSTRGGEQHEASSTTPLLGRNRDPQNRNTTSGTEQPSENIDDEWDSEDNLQNPRNWSRTFKWVMVVLVSFIEFLTTMPNFMYALCEFTPFTPSNTLIVHLNNSMLQAHLPWRRIQANSIKPNIRDAQKDLETTDSTLATFSLTIYILGFALGPLVFAPLSELYGRATVYRICLGIFLLFTLGCGLSHNIWMLVAFRFLAGCFGAAPVAIGGAVVGDLFEVSERGTAMSIYQAGQIISAVVGPPIGGLIGSYLIWRWVFWIVCFLAGFALILTFVIMRETHATTLKKRIYGAENLKDSGPETQGLAYALKQALMRPVKLLIYSRVVALGCTLIFIVIGLLNVYLTELSRTVQDVYDVSAGQSGSMYIGLALGFVLASALFGATNDRIMHWLTRRNKGDVLPEYRLPATIFGMPVLVIGMLWYGWTLQYKLQWVIPIVGSGFAGLGITTVQLSITTYMVDSFDEFSASALAAVTMARSIGGALVPLVAPGLYGVLDQGWGNTVFAAVGGASSILPLLMYKYGPKWRAMYTTDDLDD